MPRAPRGPGGSAAPPDLATVADLLWRVDAERTAEGRPRLTPRRIVAAAAAAAVAVVDTAGLAYVTVTPVAASVEAGIVLENPGGRLDPAVDGPLAHANMLMHGSAARLLTAVLLTAAGYAILRAGVLPRWTGYPACAIAAVHLAFVPSLFFGTDAACFYSAVGWGNTALTAALLVYWAFAVGIALLRRTPRAGLRAAA
ncbi:hypothetical protein ACGFZK_13715 [Streptomyces sp. NPDC048257]|uniref:hypothetical protein n=1 Tax=Streptomyces sp. NPDC048257 TaxID=3365526 RepID=UPI003710E248